MIVTINNVNALQFSPCTPLSSNSLLINVLLPPPFSRKYIVLKLHQPAHQQRGTSFSLQVTYHSKKISPLAHAAGTHRWHTQVTHSGGTPRWHTPLPQPHTITHIIVHICFYLPFHLLYYPISHIYPCSTPLLQQLTITKKITIFIRIPHNETITILLYKSHSNLHILPHTLPHDSLPRQTKTHPNYLSHYGWPALPLASVTVPLQNITTQICYYDKLCHTNRIKNFLTR